MTRNLKPLIAALIALLFYTITDILIWQRIFEANQMTQYAGKYHIGWFFTLAGYALIGVLLMWSVWKDCFYFLTFLFVGAFSGLEDVLYYLLDRKPMPYELPWLDNNPMIFHISREGVIGSVLFWMTGLAVLYAVLYLRNKNPLTETAASIINVSENIPEQ